MQIQPTQNNNGLKRYLSSSLLVIIAIVLFEIKLVKSQFIYRQADRAQIIYDDVISSSLSSGSRDKTIYFQKPFLNVPKITFSILYYYTNIGLSQGFDLNTINIYNDKVDVRVKSHGVKIYTLRIAILATDFPNSMAITENNVSGNSNKQYTVPGNIIGYCAFFHGFKGGFFAGVELHFKFSLSKTTSNTIKVSYNTSSNVNYINFNGLIVYETSGFDSLLYSFIFSVGPNYKVLQFDDIKYDIATDLSNSDRVLYGYRYYSIRSNSYYSPSINTLDSNNPISNNNIKFQMLSKKSTVDDGDISIFQLMMRVCPSSRYIILRNSQYQCVSTCSTVDSRTYNDPNKKFNQQYQEYIMNECSVCNPACYGCKGPSDSDCTSCESGFFYDSVLFKCVTSWPQKQYCEQKTIDTQTYQNCQSCHESCQTCTGPLANQCTSCTSNFKYSYNGQCLASPIDGVYCDENVFICKDCIVSNCKSCTPTLETCSACKSNFYLYKNTCYSSIQDGSYCNIQDNNNICYDCDYSKCVNCQNTAENCTSCKLKEYLYNNICYQTQPEKTTCSQVLSPVQYYTCEDCSTNCLTCTGTQTNQCSSCISNYYFYNNSCTQTQPASTFCNVNLICQNCHKYCKECSLGINDDQCSECYDGKYLNSSTNMCDVCQKGCSKCLNQFNYCTECSIDYILDSNIHQCVKNCLPGQYFDQITRECAPCGILNCSTCNEAPNICTTCLSSFYLYNNMCQAAAQDKSYCIAQTNNSYICQDCDSAKCVNCSNAADHCISCKSNEYLSHNICYTIQPQQTICNLASSATSYYECQDCSQNCLTCTGTQSNECSTCINNAYFYNNSCTLIQPPSTFCDANKRCDPCYSDCKECSLGKNQNQCSDCYEGNYLKNSTNTCEVCGISNCSTCNGDPNTCTACLKNFYLYKNTCYSTPQDGSYCLVQNNNSFICQDCDYAKCVNCSNAADHCISCKLNEYLSHNICYTIQPQQTICNLASSATSYYECQDCSQNCLTCTGTQSNECSTCINNAYFYNNSCTLIQPPSTFCDANKRCDPCYSDCKECSLGKNQNQCSDCYDDKYLNSSTNTCDVCQKGCSKCVNQLSYCTECTQDYILDSNTHQCVKNCQPGQYFDQITRECEPCGISNCSTCNQDPNTCTTCLSNFYLYKNACSNTPTDGSYCTAQNNNNSFICQDCDYTKCVNCSNAADYCTSCKQNEYLSHNICNQKQPSQTVYCSPQCLTCTGTQPNECSTCINNAYFYNNSCTLIQPPSTFCDTNLKCSPCHEYCKECSLGINDNQCSDCQDGKYLNTLTNTCDACQRGCSKCVNQFNHCTECTPDYIFDSDIHQCVKTCQSGEYYDQITDSCTPCGIQNCSTCNEDPNTCKLCNSNFYLYNNICHTTEYDGSYCIGQNNNSEICHDCDYTKCVNCVNSSDNCVSCKQNEYLFQNVCYQKYPDSAICYPPLSPQVFSSCDDCSTNCLTCSGTYINECNSCLKNSYFYNNQCTLTQPESTFCDDKLICFPCHQNCKECSLGINDNQCTECYDGKYLNTQTNTCDVCQKGCAKCQNKFNYCTECTPDYIFDSNINQCILHCQTTEYFDEETRDCTDCHSSCTSCIYKSINDCQSCISSASLSSKNQCICSDPSFGFSADYKNCEKCEVENCQTCLISSHCDVCIPNSTYDANTNKCICNKGYYYNTEQKSCITCPQKNCLECSIDGSECTQCESGFLLSPIDHRCGYCNNFKYTAENTNSCSQDCPQLCEVCSNGQNCMMYDKDDKYYVPPQLCHFTCKRCFGLKDTECNECSSDTREYNQKTNKCECLSNYKETNQPDCEKIYQVEQILIDFHSKFNQVSFPVQSLSVFLNLSPTLTYSSILQQFVGDLSYVKHNQENLNQIFTFYTKYNLNNLYTLNSSTNQQKNEESTLKISRLLRNSNISFQNNLSRNLEITTTNPSINNESQSELSSNKQSTQIDEGNNWLEVQREYRLYYVCVIPLATIIILIFISCILHLMERYTHSLLKYSYIIKWNSIIFATMINSNFMLFCILNCDMAKQEMRDIICGATFACIYISLLIYIYYTVKTNKYLTPSFSILHQYFAKTTFAKYHFFYIEAKKIVFILFLTLTLSSIKYSIWGLIGLLILDIILKIMYNPFLLKIDIYSTISLDVIFCGILALFGIIINSSESNGSQFVSFVSLIMILLILFSLITILMIVYKIILFIRNYKKQNYDESNQNNKMIDSSRYSSRTSSRSLQQELSSVSNHINVKWHKNPIHKSIANMSFD